MIGLAYTVEIPKSLEEAANAIEERTAAKGFGVIHTHDAAATLTAKGLPLRLRNLSGPD